MRLTKRQKRVLLGIAVGETIEETAARLGITKRTVKYHRTAIFEHLEIESQQKLQSRIIARLLAVLELEDV